MEQSFEGPNVARYCLACQPSAVQHENRLGLAREKAERDLRGWTRYGLILTPTTLLDLADEIGVASKMRVKTGHKARLGSVGESLPS